MKLTNITCHQPVWLPETKSNETSFGVRAPLPEAKAVEITADQNLIYIKFKKSGVTHVIPWANIRVAERSNEVISPANSLAGSGESAGSTSIANQVAGVPQAKRSPGRKKE